MGIHSDMKYPMKINYTSYCPTDTRALARALVTRLKGGELIGLNGPLGIGKTEFIRGIVEGLKINECVSSPTYVLEHVYARNSSDEDDVLIEKSLYSRGIHQVHHWDLYRLNPNSFSDEVLEYVGEPDHLIIVEWSERFTYLRDLLSVNIELESLADLDSDLPDDARLIKFEGPRDLVDGLDLGESTSL